MIRVWNDIFGLSEFSLSETAHERSSTRYVNLALLAGGGGGAGVASVFPCVK